MKHLRKIMMLMLTVVFIAGCSGKPKDMDQNTYDLGCKALEIMDSCNQMKISKDDAYDQLSEIYDRLESREFDEDQKKQEYQNSNVHDYILVYQIDMSAGNDLFKSADKLRKVLNK
jgi:hypothetical protein